MTKSDLKNGMIVELRNGKKYIVIDDRFINEDGWLDLNDYTESLLCSSSIWYEWDIMKVYGHKNGFKIFCTDIETLMKSSSIVCVYHRVEDEKLEELQDIQKNINELKDELKELSQRLENLLND